MIVILVLFYHCMIWRWFIQFLDWISSRETNMQWSGIKMAHLTSVCQCTCVNQKTVSLLWNTRAVWNRISESNPAVFVGCWKWILIISSVCILVSTFILEKQAVDLRHLSGISIWKVNASALKLTPDQAWLFTFRTDKMVVCAGNHEVNKVWLPERIQSVLEYQLVGAIIF